MRYIEHLRSEHQQSPRLAAEIEHTAAKAELLRLRAAKERRELVPKEVYDSMIDEFAGVPLTALGSLPARCAPRGDLVTTRRVEQAVRGLPAEIAAVFAKTADECDRQG